MKQLFTGCLAITLCGLIAAPASHANCKEAVQQERPADIVPLSSIAPDIIQEIRYAGADNFLGRPVAGYSAASCHVTQATAEALAAVQSKVQEEGLSLKVFDCFRPQQAVDDFMAWAAGPASNQKAVYFPNVEKAQLVPQGYIAECSGHSRGSTVDLTLVKPGETGEDNRGCNGSGNGELDMGTGYDCFDPLSSTTHAEVDMRAQRRRLRLASIMERNGFTNYSKEWWHFTLKNEPYPDTYFNFPVE